MALAEQTPYVVYTPNGVTTEFSFPFCLFREDDLLVELDDVDVTDSVTIAGVGDRAGGTVTFATAPTGTELVIKLSLEFSRDGDYQDNGDLLADSLNNDLDKIWQALRYLYQNYLIGIKLPLETATDQQITAAAASRADKLLGFDGSGDLALLAAVDADLSTVTAFAATLLDDANAAAARTTLGIESAAQTQSGIRYVTTSAESGYALTPSPDIVAYAAGQRFTAKIHNSTDTEATEHTIAVSGLAPKNIKRYDHTGTKVDTMLVTDQIAILEYDGTDFVILNPLPSSPITGTAGSYVGYDTNGNITEVPGPIFNAKFTSASYAIENNTAYASIAHGLGVVPDMVIMKLKCVNVSGSGGYAENDVLDVMSMGNTGDKYCCDYDDTNITIKVIDPVTTGNIKVRAKGGGASSQTNVPKEDWEILVVCYAFVTPA